MNCVQISGQTIKWPGICACCCRIADDSLALRGKKAPGKKGSPSHSKDWAVPYCHRCLTHIKAAQGLRAFSMRVLNRSVVFGLAGGLAAAVGFVAAAGKSVYLAAVLATVLAVATVLLILLTYAQCQAKYHEALQAKKVQRARLEQQLKALLSPSCCEEGRPAVEYDGWQGTAHRFFFASAHFARAFEKANPGKCLHEGQMPQ
jgi:hypothetical protein